MIAAYILIQTEVGKAAIVAAALRDLPGVSETASVAGPYDVIARAEARDIDELGKLVASRVQALDGVTQGCVQAVCSCGCRSPVFAADKTTGMMDPVQHAADAGDLHEWQMSLR